MVGELPTGVDLMTMSQIVAGHVGQLTNFQSLADRVGLTTNLQILGNRDLCVLLFLIQRGD